MAITDEQYQRDGYLVVEDVLGPDEVATIEERLRQYVRGERTEHEFERMLEPSIDPAAFFTTDDRSEWVESHPIVGDEFPGCV